MKENIDLTKILKDCPKGTKLYSAIHGEVQLLEVKESDNDYPIIVGYNNIMQTFAKDGRFIIEHKDSECTIFPSKNQRDWSKWKYPKPKKPKFDPKTLQPFDKVLCRQHTTNWQCNMFSYTEDSWRKIPYPFHCFSNSFMYAIPYNDDTKHLVGTTEEAPEYYRYWEE